MKTILILESNPRKDLNLNQEIRDLRGVIERSRNRESFDIQVGTAVRPEDLQELMLKYEPQIVHFCGHGTGETGLIFQDAEGLGQPVTTDALSNLFRLCAEQVECVVLNACYSEVQAEAIVEHIDYAIGMQQAIGDYAAQHFSQGFYRALGYGKPIELAYEFGCNAIQLMLGAGSERTRAVMPQRREIDVERQRHQLHSIPEFLKPTLLLRRHLRSVYLEAVAKPTTEELEGLSQILVQEDALEQYRIQVREFLVDHELSKFEEIRLRQVQRRLGLSKADAMQIFVEEQAPLQHARDEYEEMVVSLIEAGLYPFDAGMQRELEKFQQQLGLFESEIDRIEKPIFAALEEQKAQLSWSIFQFQTVQIDSRGQIIEKQTLEAESFVENLGGGVILEMVRIPGGEFLIGAAEGEEWASKDEYPQHWVTVSTFCMGRFAVTQAQYQEVMGMNPSNFKGDRRPVEQVSWNEAQEFCKELSVRVGREYRLPSEAEWEYACRAGTTTPFYFGKTISTDLANYRGQDWHTSSGETYPGRYGAGPLGSFREETTDVGSFPANAFGLYDMHGNTWEWNLNQYNDYEAVISDTSSTIPSYKQELHVVRGGCWHANSRFCRSASRIYGPPGNRRDKRIGFRVVFLLEDC